MVFEIELYYGGRENDEEPESMVIETVEFNTVTELETHAYARFRQTGATGYSFGPQVAREADGSIA